MDLEKALLSGVRRELMIEPEAVESFEFYGVALEHSHLNTALLAVVRLDMSSKEVAPRVKRSEDFVRHDFVPLDTAYKELFENRKPKIHPRAWHPTARLRALLAIRRYYPQTLPSEWEFGPINFASG